MKATLEQIREWLDAKVIACPDRLDIEVETVLACDLMSDLLAHCKPGALLITGLSNVQMVKALVAVDMCAAVVARGKLPDEQVFKMATELNVPILATKKSLFEACGLLYKKGLRGVPPGEHFVHVVRTTG